MRYEDPLRPKIGNLPSLIAKNRESLHSVVCAPIIRRWSDASFHVGVTLRVEHNRYAYEWRVIHNGDLANIMTDYYNDPEATLVAFWNWTQPDKLMTSTKTGKSSAANEFTLADLGF